MKHGLLTSFAVLAAMAAGTLTVGAMSSAATGAAAPTVSARAQGQVFRPPANCHSNNPVVKQAIAYTEAHTIPATKWYGPSSGPKLKPHQKIVYIPTDATNELSYTWGEDILAIAKKIGWSATMIDGKGTQSGWDAAMTEALALKPNAIIYSANAPSLVTFNKEAKASGIAIIGLHATAYAGAAPQYDVYDNVTTQPNAIGETEAEYAIAASCGTAKAIIEYDSTYAVATVKAFAIRAAIERCTTCKLLAFVNSPLAELSTLQPGLCSSWVSKYGTGWWALTIYDGVWDYCVPSLKAAGVSPSAVHLIGSDGTSSAYNRMRTGAYQVATVPEPAQMQAYIAIDEANRAILGLKPDYGSGPGEWVQPAYLAFDQAGNGSNLSIAGGAKDQYYPENGYAQRFLSQWGVKF